MTNTMPQTTRDALAEIGIEPSPEQVTRLARFLDLLLDANQRFNLTAIRDLDEAWTRHIFDSLTLLPVVGGMMPEAIIDVGSGGGLPGLPLAIMLPDSQVTLLEATGKKTKFLQEVVDDLGLANVQVVQERAEEFAKHKAAGRDAFDVAIARAVGPMRVLLELIIPMIHVGGIALAIKGARADEELDAAAHALSVLRTSHLDTIETPTGRIVILEKTGPTPREYPRRSGEPKHNPL